MGGFAVKWKLLVLLFIARLVPAQVVVFNTDTTSAGAAVTTVAQTIVGPDGNPAAGQMLIRISTACRTQSAYVGRETIVVKFSAIVNNFSVKLVPNDADGCRGTNYSVARLLTGGQQESATWLVPTTNVGTTVSVDSIETSASQPLPSWAIQWQQLSQGGAQAGETPVYNGLSWLPGYPTGATFVDAETPGGTLDGANATFTLAGTPNPPASLNLTCNGLIQKPGVDYTLSGSTITFTLTATPLATDTLLAWYRTGGSGTAGGPPGPAGATGPTGAASTVPGPTGPQGATGPQGPQGVIGPQGPQGPQGVAGVTGAAGSAGAQGPQGPTGATGSQGVAGATGPQGVAGATGPAGPAGPTGPTGNQGTAGIGYNPRGTYAPGTTYAQGDEVTYSSGMYLSLQTSNTGHQPDISGGWWLDMGGVPGPQGPTGATGAASSVPGPTGPQGPAGTNGTNGNTVWNGTGAPSSGTGVGGDFYLDTAASCLYGPKAFGAWPGSCTSLVSTVAGPAGPAGPTGSQGIQGIQGVAGVTGPQGPTGATGSNGTNGTNGTNGNTIWNGIGAPSSGTGANGDYYLDNAATCLYGPKASGAWPGSCTSLIGPAGATGATGPAGSSSATWPSTLGYFPGTMVPPNTYANATPTAATAYCTDYYDPYTITVSTIATLGGSSQSGKYQAIAVFDTSGNQLFAVNVSEATGSNWNKFTLGTPYTLNAGLHSWCTAWESGSGNPSAWWGTASYANWMNPVAGISGAGRHNYTCSTAPTGSGSSFAIPTNGNCAASGTKTSVSVLNPGWVTVIVNP